MRVPGRRGGVAGLAATALAVAAFSAPAQADPPPDGLLHGAGAYSTQDVMQRIADEPSGLLVSWHADRSDLIDPKGIWVTRPRGSREGLDALRRSLGGNVPTPWAPDPVPVGSGAFDWARSSIAPKASELSSTGELVFVPFAIERVQYASHVSSSAPTNLTITNLQQLYSTRSTMVGGSTITATTWSGASAVIGDVTLYMPQDGTEARSLWLSSMGVPSGALSSWVFDRYDPTTGLPTRLSTGAQVQADDGTVLAADLNGTDVAIVPFSASQWTAQENSDETGVIDRRNGALLRGSAISREVFNVASYGEVTDSASPVFEAFNQAAAGGAEACDSTIIERFGFQTTPDCGEIREDRRVVLVP